MSIKPWQEREASDDWVPADQQTAMQSEINELRAALAERDAGIERLKSHLHTCGPTCSKAGCVNGRLQAELDEERRLNSMGTEREYVLLGKLAEMTSNRDEYQRAMSASRPLTNIEILNLHAKRSWPRVCFADKSYGIALDRVAVIDFVRELEAIRKGEPE